MAGRMTRHNTAASTKLTVRSDHPEQGMIVPVNGLETALNNMANIMERLDKALPGPSGTRDVPTRQPRQVLRTTSSPILQELHDPEEVERERHVVARRRAEELAQNSKVNGDWARAASQVIGNGNENPWGTIFERISRQKAHVSERLGKNPDKAPQGWIRPQASQVASSNREPRQRIGRGGSQAPVWSLVVLDEDEVQSQVRVPAPQRLGPPVPEAGEFQDLRQQIQEMQRKINRGRVFTTRTNTPLAPKIFAEPYPQGFKMPFVKRYDGESDPQEHINNYVQVMIAVDATDALMCRCFLQTVDSKVADWVNHIPAGSIRTWDELGLRFLEHFVGNCRPKRHFTHLASNEMARLICRGHLKKFVQDGDAGNPGNNFIIRGNTGGDSATSRKKWANAAMVNKVLVPEGKKLKTEPIVFSHADLPETGVPHRDAVVITIDIMDLLIHKTLVDTGSSVNIMYMDTYKALGLTRDELSPIKTPLTGFTGDSIEPEGGSQRVSRAWYLKATKQPVKYDTQVGEVTAQLLRAEERRPRVEVAGDIEEVELELGTPGRLVRIGKGLGAELRSRVISVLRRFMKVFVWSPADMPGLDHKIAVHRLNVLRDAKPVKQKRTHLSQERRDFVKKE
ncbi:unnamed protein product, partial [Cuscuta campestris]